MESLACATTKRGTLLVTRGLVRSVLVPLAFVLGGCTADTFAPSDAGDAGNAGDATDARVDAADDATPPDAPAEVSEADACIMQPYYFDFDGDGWGGTQVENACAPPTDAWVVLGGDCDDSNPDVHPGQTSYFTMAYTPTGKTSRSFDYDCDGKETESGSPPKDGCQVVNLACVGDEYLPLSPSRGAGADDYCGSASEIACSGGVLACKASAPFAASEIGCR